MSYIDSDAIRVLLNSRYAESALRGLESIRAYASFVMEYADKHMLLEAQRASLDADEYKGRVEDLEYKRTSKHNAAISALAKLNRITERCVSPAVYVGDIDTDERGQIAHAIFAFCKQKLDEDQYGSVLDNNS